jgi:hypothetical protein
MSECNVRGVERKCMICICTCKFTGKRSDELGMFELDMCYRQDW